MLSVTCYHRVLKEKEKKGRHWKGGGVVVLQHFQFLLGFLFLSFLLTALPALVFVISIHNAAL